MLKFMDLRNIEPGYNFVIIGTNTKATTELKQNILHMLHVKNISVYSTKPNTCQTVISNHKYYYNDDTLELED